MAPIYRITPPWLLEETLLGVVYPDLDQSLYWDDTWDPDFYINLARAGFISIAALDPDGEPLLISELQTSYAVLDWDEVHRSRNLRDLLQSQTLADEGVELRVTASIRQMLERLVEYHGRSWILERYEDLVLELPTGDEDRFAIHAVELWSQRRNSVVAGELGYTIGRTYTSLSGFCSPYDPALRHFGTLQMYLLAGSLRDRGFAFWNMGHPSQAYKQTFGARILPRSEFLERWFGERDAVPAGRLAGACQPVPAS